MSVHGSYEALVEVELRSLEEEVVKRVSLEEDVGKRMLLGEDVVKGME